MKTTPLLMTRQNVINTRNGIKTQTRRIGQCQNDSATELGISYVKHATKGTIAQATCRAYPDGGSARWALCECPYGIPGDRIALKETWWGWGYWTDDNLGHRGKPKWRWVDETTPEHPILYDATLKKCDVPQAVARDVLGYHLRPSIFLPKVHWRTFCELTQVRAERLQDISEADCLAEGIHQGTDGAFYSGVQYFIGYKHAIDAYKELWESINVKGSFDANQWVWALTYKYLP